MLYPAVCAYRTGLARVCRAVPLRGGAWARLHTAIGATVPVGIILRANTSAAVVQNSVVWTVFPTKLLAQDPKGLILRAHTLGSVPTSASVTKIFASQPFLFGKAGHYLPGRA